MYRGPTVLVVKTVDQHVFVVAVDEEWRPDRSVVWGGSACRLIRLMPEVKQIHKGNGSTVTAARDDY